LAHSPSSALRKEIYFQANTSIPENLNVLDSLIRHRHLHSTLLGYKSYAHRVLSDRMVGTPEKVQTFLQIMQERSNHVFWKDMEVLRKAKAHVEGGAGTIEPWDVPFYTTLIKAQRQHLRWKEDDGGGDDDDASFPDYNDNGDESFQFSGYFTVEKSIEGMKVLVNELFGISMKEVEIPIEERWDIDTTKDVEIASIGGSSLRKFEFEHEQEGPLGTMFFDLHPRDGKFLHAAHFTIRCGRIRNDATNINSAPTSTRSEHQLPIVALVCNFNPSSSSSSSSSTQTLLSHSEVETLYHEFGHGLHSLLSRTSFQHLSGTRAAMDFVETPSHLLETFARDPAFLSRVLTRHYITGMPLSKRRASHLSLSHSDFRGIEIQTQIVHSKFDQALFGDAPCSPSLGGCSSTEMFQKLHEEPGVPYAKGTHWHTKFGHLVTYGAGYYGYLYAQTFAADIWMSVLASCMASSPDAVRYGGTKIWKEMLIHGGAKDPKEMIHAVLGREPSVDPFFKGMS
jgi:intermediate peptidase